MHGSKVDQRIFPRERRVGERRGPMRDAFADTDPRIRLADVLDDVIIELGDADLDEVDQTQVRPNPAGPPSGRRREPTTQRSGSSTFQLFPSRTVCTVCRSPVAE